MNILKNYIKKIIKEELIERPNGKNYYKITLIRDCWGGILEETISMGKDEWEEAKEKGYFMA